MKYVNFNYVIARNFLSIGKEEIKIDFKQGINIITGNNKDKVDRRNGVGKSTIADSIHFAIFGETIREIPKSNIINNITGKGTYVELSFSISENNKINHYKIIRTLKPTKCLLYINDEDKTESTIVNTTNKIKELLSASQELFQNCVIMSLNTTLPFMAQKKVEKRKFIEGILKLEVFSQMLQVARSEHNEVLRVYESTNKELNHQVNYKNIISKQLEERKQENNNKLERYHSDIEKRNKKLIDLKSQITEPDINVITEIKKKKIDFDNQINELTKHIESNNIKKMQHNAEIKLFEKTLKQIGTNKSKCPVCLHEISDDDRDHIRNERNKIERHIKDREADVNDIDLQINNLNKRKSSYQQESEKCKLYLKNCLSAVEHNKRIKISIKDIEEEISVLKKDISNIQNTCNNTSDLENEIKKYSEEIDKLENNADELSKNNKILDFVKFILSEEGVKSYIVKKILNILNNRLLYYLKKMDANCVCKFNEYFEEEIKNDKGQECSYFNFSGAERKNIDLACLFTFMDIRRMQGDVSYNLVMFDELLDSSLDEKGVELVINILKERIDQFKEAIYIISHRKESTKESSGEVIYLEKINGITRRVKYNN